MIHISQCSLKFRSCCCHAVVVIQAGSGNNFQIVQLHAGIFSATPGCFSDPENAVITQDICQTVTACHFADTHTVEVSNRRIFCVYNVHMLPLGSCHFDGRICRSGSRVVITLNLCGSVFYQNAEITLFISIIIPIQGITILRCIKYPV